MKYTARRNISLILSLVFVILTLVVFFSMDWPTFQSVGDLNKKITQEQTQYENQYNAVQIAKAIVNQYKSLVSVSQTISLSIPRETEVQNLLAQIDGITSQSGLLLQDVSFENISSSVPKSKTTIVQNYSVLQLTLSLTGNYDSFKTWLNAIETNIRLMDVTKISFAGLSSSENQKNLGIFNFKVTLNVYYQ